MTIRRGEPWGRPIDRPADLRSFDSDRALAIALADGLDRPVTVSAGDLHRAVGSPPPREEMQELPIDVLAVEVDGADHLAVAHVVVRRSWWRGALLAACNVGHVGAWNVAPRAHPNDGRLDIVEVDPGMGVRQRWQASRRLPHGSHVPHPAISIRTATEVAWRLDRPHAVWLDGERVADAERVTVRIRPDAASIVV